MKTFNVELEHKDTQMVKFVTIAECKDMDDCINHVHETEPDFWMMSIELAL